MRDYILKDVLPSGSPGYKQRIKRVAEQCFLDKGLVWYRLQQANRRPVSLLLCPRGDLRDQVMDAAHNSPFAGHSGKQRTIDRIQLGFWWPGITYDVANILFHCRVCQELEGRQPEKSPFCLLYTSPSPRDLSTSRMPSSA